MRINHRNPILFSIVVSFVLSLSGCGSEQSDNTQTQVDESTHYDIVFNNGRVIDPETGLDAVRNVGVNAGKIAIVSEEPLQGDTTLDIAGKVLAPGFIDIHNHSPSPLGFAYQAQDGVTTTLELEAGAFPVNEYGGMIANQPLLNFGASAGLLQARMQVMSGLKQAHFLDKATPLSDKPKSIEATFIQQATDSQIQEIRSKVEQGLKQGGIGIGLPLDYISVAVGEAELDMVFDVAAQYKVPVFVHIRRGIAGDPAGLDEVLAMADKHNAQVHICHLSHSAMQNTQLFLDKIRQARANGVQVTTEVLPYNAGSVMISAAVFSRDWKKIFNISYEDVQLASTGEWFTKESFERTQKENPRAAIIHHYVKEPWTAALVKADDVIISSDGLPAISTSEKVPPQGVGSFSKILGTYVREQKLLSMTNAINKMSTLPAKLLENAAPVFRNKGRIQNGMDADIIVFDPQTVKANTTYENPHQASTGMEFVLVNGQFVVKDGALQKGVYAGKRLLSGSNDDNTQ